MDTGACHLYADGGAPPRQDQHRDDPRPEHDRAGPGGNQQDVEERDQDHGGRESQKLFRDHENCQNEHRQSPPDRPEERRARGSPGGVRALFLRVSGRPDHQDGALDQITRQPPLEEFADVHRPQPPRRIGHAHLVSIDAVYHHHVTSGPLDDAGKRNSVPQVLERRADARSLQPDPLGSADQTEQGDAVAPLVAEFAQSRSGDVDPVVLRDHLQARRAAVPGLDLPVKRKRHRGDPSPGRLRWDREGCLEARQ